MRGLLGFYYKPYFYFDAKKLVRISKSHRREYRGASPFPYAVIDNFLPEWVAKRLLDEFIPASGMTWRREDGNRKKIACLDVEQMGPFTRHVLSQFNSSTFIRFLENLAGIKGLVPDPHGAGLHQVESGGYLGIHVDFNKNAKLNLDRRINVLIYLNRGWKSAYGGNLELWEESPRRCAKIIEPIFNRCVIFNTTDRSFHGHPEPLACPQGSTRKVIVLYYYTNGRQGEAVKEFPSTFYLPGTAEEKGA